MCSRKALKVELNKDISQMDDSSLKNYRLQMTAVIDKSSLRDAPQIKKRENVGIFPKWGTPRQSYNLQFETPGLPRLPRLWDSQDSGTPKTPGRPMEKVKATSRKFHSSPNHFQVQIQA